MKNYKKYLEEAKPSVSIGKWKGGTKAYISGFAALAKAPGKAPEGGYEIILKNKDKINIDPTTAGYMADYLNHVKDKISDIKMQKVIDALGSGKKGFNMVKGLANKWKN